LIKSALVIAVVGLDFPEDRFAARHMTRAAKRSPETAFGNFALANIVRDRNTHPLMSWSFYEPTHQV
jgi:hypothetical protein